MFIKTQYNTLLNLDRVTCLDVLKWRNENSATVKAKADGYDILMKVKKIKRKRRK